MAPKNDRSQLKFQEAVSGAFGFLCLHGFQTVRSTPTFVRYESDRVFVNVFHGRRSFELGLELGRLSSPRDTDRPFGVEWLIRMMDPPAASGFRYTVARTRELVFRGTQNLAAILRQYGDAALGGDEQVFRELERQSDEFISDYALRVRVAQVAPIAERAFQERDYATAAHLFSSIRAGLTVVQLKKLDYAQRHAR